MIMGWVIGISAICAWFTHIFFCFSTASWLLLLAGAIFFPIGIIHGVYLWFT